MISWQSIGVFVGATFQLVAALITGSQALLWTSGFLFGAALVVIDTDMIRSKP